MMELEQYYIGVDVGTSSVRAGLFDSRGQMVALSAHNIDVLEPEPTFYEQSSDNIWNSCCSSIKSVTATIDKSQVKGIGFDATCSLVVLDRSKSPLSVSPTGDSHWNVIMWMDHRAAKQAELINKTGHPVLDYVGGAISLEMQMPKLLWLKQNMKESCWEKAGHFMDLPDYLTWKATGSLSRSLCSLVCKWTYQANENEITGWDESFLKQIDLEDLISKKFEQIGTDVLCPGEPCGKGLSDSAARDFDLPPGIPVATSIIDAHAGGLGCLGCVSKSQHSCDDLNMPLTNKLALICGTSSCHMAVSSSALSVPGVWGPYYSAMVPELWLSEGGQSAAGKLLDHVVQNHLAFSWIKDDAEKKELHIYEVLEEVLQFIAKKRGLGMSDLDLLTSDLHVWPDYHGNRSPVADPSLKGMVCGLSLESGVEDLAVKYLATVQALSYGTQHIIEALNAAGHNIKVICACGGLAKNQLFVQTHANVTGLPIILPTTQESVLLGSAILGARASGNFPSIQDAMAAMGGSGEVVKPNITTKNYHKKKLAVFHKMLQDQREYKAMMTDQS